MRTDTVTVAAGKGDAQLWNVYGFSMNPFAVGDTIASATVIPAVLASIEYANGDRRTMWLRAGQAYHSAKLMTRVWFTCSVPGSLGLDVAEDADDELTPYLTGASVDPNFGWQRFGLTGVNPGDLLVVPAGAAAMYRPAGAKGFALVIDYMASMGYGAGGVVLDEMLWDGTLLHSVALPSPLAYAAPASWAVYSDGRGVPVQSVGNVGAHFPFAPPPRLALRNTATGATAGIANATLWVTARWW